MNNINPTAVLSQKIQNHFNLNELKTVIVDMGADIEEFNGPLSQYTRQAVTYFERRDKLVEFAKALAHRKPNIDFSPWGASLPKESLQGVLRQLLDIGFNNSNLSQLCFDLFYDLHGEISSAMSKSRTIELIIDHAIKNDAVLNVMEWVRGENPYQYSAFFDRVDKALQSHQNKETVYAVPAEPINEPTAKKQAPESDSPNAAMLLALKMYAQGVSDGGELARQALKVMETG